ncbi:MAG: CPBP family glutamic-type intramembrane protease, partial [Planctomycetota bacterium]
QGLLVAAAAYCVVHVWAWNMMLLAAAAICGLFWGWMMLRFRSLWPGMICHVVWDVAVFVLLPIGEAGA